MANQASGRSFRALSAGETQGRNTPRPESDLQQKPCTELGHPGMCPELGHSRLLQCPSAPPQFEGKTLSTGKLPLVLKHPNQPPAATATSSGRALVTPLCPHPPLVSQCSQAQPGRVPLAMLGSHHAVATMATRLSLAMFLA